MANFTKQAIKRSFLTLLEERPLSKITVKDIVAVCGINRNTFYYHFQDIPSLIEELIMEAAEQIVAQYPSADTIDDFFESVIDYMLERKKMFLHIYHSTNREMFEQYLWQVCSRIVILYTDTVLNNSRIRQDDHQIIIQYLTCLSFGFLSGWLQAGLNEDIRISFQRILEIKKGSVNEMIRRLER